MEENERVCPWGNCTVSIVDGEIAWAYGPIGCPCDYLSGWRSKHYEGMSKPHPPIKAIGRHGGRIARGERRTREAERWMAKWSS